MDPKEFEFEFLADESSLLDVLKFANYCVDDYYKDVNPYYYNIVGLNVIQAIDMAFIKGRAIEAVIYSGRDDDFCMVFKLTPKKGGILTIKYNPGEAEETIEGSAPRRNADKVGMDLVKNFRPEDAAKSISVLIVQYLIDNPESPWGQPYQEYAGELDGDDEEDYASPEELLKDITPAVVFALNTFGKQHSIG